MSAALEARWPALRAAWRKLAGGGDPSSPLSKEERARIVAGIGVLSSGLTRERALVGARYLDDPSLLGAYLLFYWPVSYAQASSVLGELGRSPGRTLDLGAGPMPMGWAAIDAGATSLVAIDRVERALQLGRSLARAESPIDIAAWDPQRGDVLPQGPFDTILAGHVLNELFLGARSLDKRAALVGSILARLAPGGRLILVEPALRETSRALEQLRDRLIGEGVVVHAPCLMQASCPALVRESDWCHAERAWDPPAELVALAEAAKLHKDRLKLSYLVLSPPGPIPRHPPSRFRIVSEPLPSKGKSAHIGCGPRGRHPLVRRDRDRTEANVVFDELVRGDVVEVAPLGERGDGLRLDDTSAVERVAPVGAPPPEGLP